MSNRITFDNNKIIRDYNLGYSCRKIAKMNKCSKN